MIGVSWRQGGTESLADFTPRGDDVNDRLIAFAADNGLTELALIATCNRVEMIFVRSPGSGQADLRPSVFRFLTGRDAKPGEAERSLRAWHGEGAAERLFLIAAGLDSACVGETEIVGQVKTAQDAAHRSALAGPNLDLIFEEALRIAARVRGETRIGAGRVSLAEIAAASIRERLAQTPGPVALIGVSPMTERAATTFAAEGQPFIVVNRSTDRARKLAEQHAQAYRGLNEFLDDPPAIEALLSATGADAAVIDKAALERICARTESGEAPLVVDMAVPADVDPEACAELGLERVGMDAIVKQAEQNRAARLTEAADAREQVDAALDGLQERLAERFYGPLLGALQRRYQRTADEGVKRLLRKELTALGDEERNAIETWTRVLARRFAHIPCLGLRGLIHAGPDGSVDAFLDGLEPEFADELRQALASSEESRRET